MTYQILDISKYKGDTHVLLPLTFSNIQKYGSFDPKKPKSFSMLVKLSQSLVVRFNVVDVKKSENSDTNDFLIITMAPDKNFLRNNNVKNYKNIVIRLDMSS